MDRTSSFGSAVEKKLWRTEAAEEGLGVRVTTMIVHVSYSIVNKMCTTCLQGPSRFGRLRRGWGCCGGQLQTPSGMHSSLGPWMSDTPSNFSPIVFCG